MKKQHKIPQDSLPRWQKILLVVSDLSEGKRKTIKYEDIVVAAFKKFPGTFHLRGYKQYPDSGDLVHKPLYDMRKRGLLLANQKNFTLTSKGLQAARKLEKGILGEKKETKQFKPSRDVGKDIDRILSSAAFNFYKSGKEEKILDTDFFQYLGVSVHTSRNEFLNRMETVKYAIEETGKYYPKKVSDSLYKYHRFMVKKFDDLIKQVSGKK